MIYPIDFTLNAICLITFSPKRLKGKKELFKKGTIQLKVLLLHRTSYKNDATSFSLSKYLNLKGQIVFGTRYNESA
jgi:hypothetical protein